MITNGNTLMTGYAGVQASASVTNEVRLISAARHGDHEAFNTLVTNYQDRIYNLAVRILGDEDTASDVTQNTFLTAYLNLPRFRNGSFRSWLFRIATNACYDIFRQYKRHPVQSLDDQEYDEEKLSLLDNHSDDNSQPEIVLQQRELERVVQSALNQLDVDQRTVMILVDQQECDYQEAAEILRVPIGTVKSRLARARKNVRQTLALTLD
jgi:RNA polymerase sigma-70 factor (ECF subfamily)